MGFLGRKKTVKAAPTLSVSEATRGAHVLHTFTALAKGTKVNGVKYPACQSLQIYSNGVAVIDGILHLPTTLRAPKP